MTSGGDVKLINSEVCGGRLYWRKETERGE